MISAACLSTFGAGVANASATDCAAPPGSVSFHASFKNGTMKLGSATGTGLAADACGSVAIDGTNITATILPTDMSFAPVSVKVLFLSLPASITVNAPISGPITVNPDLTADASLTANISASAALLGFKCVIGPIKPTLTTGKSGSLTGTSFTPEPPSSFKGSVVANDFTVPGITASRSCPRLVASLANILVGLPAAAGKASLTMEGSMTIG